MRSLHLLLACTLVLAPIAGVPLSSTDANTLEASGSGTGSPGTIKHPINNSVAHLAINSSQTNETAIETVTLDVSGAVAFDGSTFHREFAEERFDATKENASDEQVAVDRALNRAENRTTELRARQKKTIKNYNDGTLSAQAFLRELAVITAEAKQLRVFIKHVERSSDRSQNLRSELNVFTGPVQTNIQSALQGDPDTSKRFFVRTSTQGIVLASVDDGQYIREVHLPEARAGPNASGSFYYPKAYNKINKSYDVNMSEDFSGSEMHRGYHRFKISLLNRLIKVRPFVDRPSGQIFYERRYVGISDKRTVRGPQNTSGPFTLETNTTYTGGYMIVRLTDPETDAEPNGNITVDGETVGTTEDGKLYMLQPPNGSTINATVDGETVSMAVGKPGGPPESGLSIRDDNRNKWQQLGTILF